MSIVSVHGVKLPTGDELDIMLGKKKPNNGNSGRGRQAKELTVKEIYDNVNTELEKAVKILARTPIHEHGWRHFGFKMIEQQYIKKGKYKLPNPEVLAKKIFNS